MITRKAKIVYTDGSTATIRGFDNFHIKDTDIVITAHKKLSIKQNVEQCTTINTTINKFDVRAIEVSESENGYVKNTVIHHIHNTTVIDVVYNSSRVLGKTKKEINTNLKPYRALIHYRILKCLYQ